MLRTLQVEASMEKMIKCFSEQPGGSPGFMDAASWCVGLIKPELGSQAVVAQLWEMVVVGTAEVVPPKGTSAPDLPSERVCCAATSVGLAENKRLGGDGVRNFARSACSAPCGPSARRHSTGRMLVGRLSTGKAVEGGVSGLCRAAGCFPWCKGFWKRLLNELGYVAAPLWSP